MKQRSELTTGLRKPIQWGKALIASKDKKATAKEIGRDIIGGVINKVHETDNIDTENAMANPSTRTIDKSQVRYYGDARERIPDTLKKAMPVLPNREEVKKMGVPAFFGENLGGKTANKDSLISKINQQFAKLGLRISELIGGSKGVETINGIMEQVFGIVADKIPGKFDDKIVDEARKFVKSCLNYMVQSSNIVALIKVYRLSMIELFLKTLNWLHDNNTVTYEQIMEMNKSWFDLWGLSSGCFTDTDTVYKYLKSSNEHIEDFVAAITYSEVIQAVLFGDPINDVGGGKKWYSKYTTEAIAEVKEAKNDGTLSLTGKEERKINKGKWPYLAEQI